MAKSDSLKSAPHSSHYKGRSVEPIDLIEAGDLGFHLGNVVKYAWRAKHFKEGEDPIKCLDKLIWYAQRKRKLMLKELAKDLKAT